MFTFPYQFESYVILDRSKTYTVAGHNLYGFESYVILDRSKTKI